MPGAAVEVLIVALNGQQCGFRASDLVELVRAVTIAPLPKAHAVVEGVIDVRGEMVPVLDLRRAFHMPQKPIEPSDHFLLLRAPAGLVALRVDRAVALAQMEIKAVAATARDVEHIAGVCASADGTLVVYDLERFVHEAQAVMEAA